MQLGVWPKAPEVRWRADMQLCIMKQRHTESKPVGTDAPLTPSAQTAASSLPTLPVPASPNSHRLDQLTNEQVVARIAQLLFEGHLLVQAAANTPTKPGIPVVVPIRAERRDKHELAVLAILRGGETATPMTLRTRVGCSRATISRVLARLLRNGAIVSTGRTKGISYGIAQKEVRAA